MSQIGRGGIILFVQKAHLYMETSWVPKIQISWPNIDQVMALCAIWHSWGLTG